MGNQNKDAKAPCPFNEWRNRYLILRNPVYQCGINYVFAYIFSLMLALITSALDSQTLPLQFNQELFFKAFFTCVFTTATTLAVSSFIAGFSVPKNQIRPGRLLALVLAAFTYILLFFLLSLYAVSWLGWIVCLGSGVLAGLGIFQVTGPASFSQGEGSPDIGGN